MKKSTVAAFAAASLLGFGAVGSAVAADVSGWVDVRYNAADESTGADHQFNAWGEVDIVHQADDAELRLDLDIANEGGVDGLGADAFVDSDADRAFAVEQASIGIPLNMMANLTIGLWNTPIGYEGQDSPDLPFASNGLLWDNQPTNHAGGRLDIMPTDMVSVTLGAANDWMGTAEENSYMATVGVTPIEGLSGAVGYITTDAANSAGNLLDIWVAYDVMDLASVYAEYMLADPDTGSGAFDSGWGIGGEVSQGMFGGAVRYEASQTEGTPEPTELSLAVFADLSETDRLSVDWTNQDPDTGGSSDTDMVVLKYVRTFDDGSMM